MNLTARSCSKRGNSHEERPDFAKLESFPSTERATFGSVYTGSCRIGDGAGPGRSGHRGQGPCSENWIVARRVDAGLLEPGGGLKARKHENASHHHLYRSFPGGHDGCPARFRACESPPERVWRPWSGQSGDPRLRALERAQWWTRGWLLGLQWLERLQWLECLQWLERLRRLLEI